jgi:pyruvate dehydrogenase E1 component alpha subunit
MISQADVQAADKSAMAEVEAAVQFAEAGTWEPVADLLRDVYCPPDQAAR